MKGGAEMNGKRWMPPRTRCAAGRPGPRPMRSGPLVESSPAVAYAGVAAGMVATGTVCSAAITRVQSKAGPMSHLP